MGRSTEIHPCTGCAKRFQLQTAEAQITRRETTIRQLEAENQAIRAVHLRERLGYIGHALANRQRITQLHGEIAAVHERYGSLRADDVENCPGLYERVTGRYEFLDGDAKLQTAELCGVEAVLEGIDVDDAAAGWKLKHPHQDHQPVPLDIPTSGDNQ